MSGEPIDSPGDGDVVAESDGEPAAAGEAESATLTAEDLNGARHVAVVYRDDAGNWGRVASVEVPGGTDPDPGPGPGPGPDPTPVRVPHPPTRLATAAVGRAATPARARPRGPSPCSNRVEGSARDDRLSGTDGPDHLRGFRGNDLIKALGGDDCVIGGRGRDRIKCGGGDDVAVVEGRDKVNAAASEIRRR